MPTSAKTRTRRPGDRPIIGTLFGYQVFGAGTIYPYVDAIARGIQAGARDHQCGLMLACGVNFLDPPAQRPAWPEMMSDADVVPVGPWNTDGLIVVHPIRSPERAAYIKRLKNSGFPVVYVGSADGGPAVDVDNEGGVHEAMRHLAGHGHRRVAFIRGFPDDDSGDSGERLRAYKTAAQTFGMELDPRLVAYGYHDIVESQRAMQRIVAAGVPFTALLASNDESAFGAIDALTQAGLRVPQDVAVVGFDDMPDSVHKLPPLTSVHHPVFERGYAAVGLLLDRIEGIQTDAIVKVPTRLVVRRSCGCNLDDILPVGLPAPENDSPDRATLEERLTKMIAAAVFSETQYLNSAEMYQVSKHLIEAFVASLARGDAGEFLLALQAVLARAEQTRASTRVWTLAIDELARAQETKALARRVGRDTDALDLAETMLHQARGAIDNSTQRRRWHELYFDSEEHGSLAARLHAAADEKQIVRILSERLPKIGIRRAAVVTIEQEDDDPAAWSVMRVTDDPDAEPLRFRTQDFPPAPLAHGLGDKYRLALAPLLIQRRIPGYVVFESDNLELCANIVHSINTALTGAYMYREAIDGRRLAEEANRLKSRFLSTVSHELRTPLGLILSTADHLASQADGASTNRQQDLARIRAGAQHLDGLIRDVLDLTQEELGQLKLAHEPLDIATMLDPVVIVGEQLAREKGLKWQADIPAQLPKIWADRARLRQVTLNLVSNAVKFTAEGQIILRVQHSDRTVTISVQDTGLGIAPDEAEIIFDDFHQSTRTTTRGYGGLGLGLAICKRLVEMHAGEIGVHSSGEEGFGSRFFYTLPVLEVDPDSVERALPREKTILLLDDITGNGEGLHARLTQRGFAVQRISVDDPAALLTSLTTYATGLVLIDAALAFGHGWETLKVLKDASVTEDIPVLFYTLTNENNAGSVLQLDYLAKPVGTAELVRALRRQGITRGAETQKTIVIADDDENLLDLHATIVEEETGCRVLRALNGREAWELIKESLPDLVLLDLNMPELNGFGVLEAMQSLETTHRIPVIVLTGQRLSGDELTRLNRGVAAIMAKGVFSMDETLARIQQTLNNRKPLNNEAQNLARKAMAYIHERYAEPLARKDIANHVQVSEDHLTRYFQQALGIPPMTYLMRYRIQRAKALLDTGNMAITDIATAVGFTNEFYFSRVFRREIGVTPNAYRRQHPH